MKKDINLQQFYLAILAACIYTFIPMGSYTHVLAASCSDNNAPRAVLGPDRNVALGEVVNFDGRTSSDPDGDTLYYSWDFDASNGIGTDQTGPTAVYQWYRAGNYTATLTVHDACASSSANVRVAVSSGLGVTIKPTVTTVAPGDTFGYTVNYSNFTGRAIDDMQLTVDYDERYVGVVDPAGGTVAGGAVVYRQDHLYQSSSEVRTFWFRVNQSGLPSGSAALMAKARLAGKEAATVESDEVVITVRSQIDLVGSMVIEEEMRRPGETQILTIGYRNRGNAVADNVLIELHYDANAYEPVQVSDGNTNARGVITWYVGALSPDQKSTREVRLRIREGISPFTADTWIRLSADNASPYEQHMLIELNGGTSVAQKLNVYLTATDDNEFRVISHAAKRNEYVTMTVIITNPFESEYKNILAHLTYPQDLFAVAELREAVDAGGALTWEIDRIEPKGTRTFTARLRVRADAPFHTQRRTTVTVSGTGMPLQEASMTNIINGNGAASSISGESTVNAAATAPRTGSSPLAVTAIMSLVSGLVAYYRYGRR